MPPKDEAFWQQRAMKPGNGHTWDDNLWLDVAHGVVARDAFKRVWPRSEVPRLVLDVGCSDGVFTSWLSRVFGVSVAGCDAVAWPQVVGRFPFYQTDAEELDEVAELRALRPDMVVLMDVLTFVADWQRAVDAIGRLGPRYVLVFDNLMTPSPRWMKDLAHRTPITQPDLRGAFTEAGYWPARVVGADWSYWRFFLGTPRLIRPLMATAATICDLMLTRALPARICCHCVFLFERLPSRAAPRVVSSLRVS